MNNFGGGLGAVSADMPLAQGLGSVTSGNPQVMPLARPGGLAPGVIGLNPNAGAPSPTVPAAAPAAAPVMAGVPRGLTATASPNVFMGHGNHATVFAARGGAMLGPGAPPNANIANSVTGALRSPVAGRTDHLPISVPTGAYVIPADVVSALGQGNTRAGETVLTKMFGAMPPQPPGTPPQPGRTDIMAAGGEFVVSPQAVARIGNGNMKLGHAALDKWVQKVRADNVSALRSLPGPHR